MLKVLELFSGTGCQVQALKNIGIECVSTQCEIDKYAVNTYNQLHGETPNLGDIAKVNPDNLQQGQWDLITYSFPCQSISIAGKQAGLAKNSGTTSSLLWECEKIIRKVKPKYLLMENVANLLSDKFKPFFYSWLKTLEEMGYCSYYDVLNAKDFGIPQNRSRIFCVSILGKHVPYVFPQKQPLKLRLKDMLEDSPDEKYYLSNDKIDKISRWSSCQKPLERVLGKNSIAPTITASMGLGGGHVPMVEEKQERLSKQAYETLEENKCKDGDVINPFNKKVVDDGICPTITTRPEGFKTANLIVVDESIEPNLKKKIEKEKENIANSNKDIYNIKSNSGFNDNAIGLKVSPTIRTKNKSVTAVDNHFRIRKLTERECWRLQGWKDEQFDKIKGISRSQLYKMAGNGIVINVLEAIFTNMFLRKPTKEEEKFVVDKPMVQMDLF